MLLYVSLLLFLVAKETQNTLPIIVGMGVPLMVLLLVVIVAVAIILIRKRQQFIAGVRMGVWVLQNDMHIYDNILYGERQCRHCFNLLQIYLPGRAMGT